jgi:glycosyltransferase involved in cell wall biosynthesis
VLLEAAACGVPVIGSTVDGSKEALLGGALGRLVDPRDLHALGAAVRTMIGAKLEHSRPPGVEFFGVPAFQAKVRHWLETEANAGTRPALAA